MQYRKLANFIMKKCEDGQRIPFQWNGKDCLASSQIFSANPHLPVSGGALKVTENNQTFIAVSFSVYLARGKSLKFNGAFKENRKKHERSPDFLGIGTASIEESKGGSIGRPRRRDLSNDFQISAWLQTDAFGHAIASCTLSQKIHGDEAKNDIEILLSKLADKISGSTNSASTKVVTCDLPSSIPSADPAQHDSRPYAW